MRDETKKQRDKSWILVRRRMRRERVVGVADFLSSVVGLPATIG